MTVTADAHSFQPLLRVNCRFCHLRQFEIPIIERPIGLAVPSIGAYLEGWLLVVPYRHTIALADLTECERIEFDMLAHEAEQLVIGRYGRTVMFEHGPAMRGRSAGCGVDHAHLHIVPINMVLHEAVTTDEDGRKLEWRPATQPWDAHIEHSIGLDYLFVREVDGTAWLTATPAAPSQLFRRAIAEYLGEQNWDWKDDFRHEVVASTYRGLLDSSTSSSVLPYRNG